MDIGPLCASLTVRTLENSMTRLRKALSLLISYAEVLAEKQGMTQEEVDAIARAFEVDSKALVSVFNGRLAEGIDLSAELVLLIGVPFAAPTPRREKLLRRLKELLGDEDSARLHGLVLPAVYSAVQAAGRAIRGPEDNALVLLVDDRYRRLLPLLPR